MDAAEKKVFEVVQTEPGSPVGSQHRIVTDAELAPPNLLDEELKDLLALRGKQQAKIQFVIIAVGLTCGMLIGLTLTMLGLPATYILAAAIVYGIAVGAIRTKAVAQAYKQRQYDLATKLMPRAIWWNSMWSPFTYFHLISCIRMQVSLLLLEGRFIELEILSRYAWAYSERKTIKSGVPKNWAVGNNIAIALVLQWRFEEAEALLKQVLANCRGKEMRLVLLNNIALCQVRMKRADEAQKTLAQALEIVKGKTDSTVGLRLSFINGLILTQQGSLEQAEAAIDNALAVAVKRKEPLDFQAHCNAALGAIRSKQQHYDEAELYYQNAIEIMESANNPDYFGLARYLRDYSNMLMEAGKADAAADKLQRAESYSIYHVKRERETVERVRRRLKDKKPIRLGTELLEVANRERFLEFYPD